MKRISFLLYLFMFFLFASHAWAIPLLTDTIYTDQVFYPTYYTATANSDETSSFFMTFNKEPDFYSSLPSPPYTPGNTQPNMFVIYIDSTGTRDIPGIDQTPGYNETDRMLSAQMINTTNMLQFYDKTPCTAIPCENPTFTLIDDIPFTLNGMDMEFTIPMDTDFFTYNMQLQEKKQFPDVGEAGFTAVLGASGKEYTTLVPEPTTMLLLGAGLVGLAGFGRKRFKKK